MVVSGRNQSSVLDAPLLTRIRVCCSCASLSLGQEDLLSSKKIGKASNQYVCAALERSTQESLGEALAVWRAPMSGEALAEIAQLQQPAFLHRDFGFRLLCVVADDGDDQSIVALVAYSGSRGLYVQQPSVPPEASPQIRYP